MNDVPHVVKRYLAGLSRSQVFHKLGARVEASGRPSSTVQRIGLKPRAECCRAPRRSVAVVLDTSRDAEQVRFHVTLQFERFAARSVLQDIPGHGRNVERTL